jgi:hypothetical protein
MTVARFLTSAPTGDVTRRSTTSYDLLFQVIGGC